MVKFEIEKEIPNELIPYIFAEDNYSVLWFLIMNFHRNWKHSEGKSEEYMKGVHDVLEELRLAVNHVTLIDA